MQNNEPQSPPHNDLGNLDSLTSQQINELYDDIYIDSFQDDRIVSKCMNLPGGSCGYMP